MQGTTLGVAALLAFVAAVLIVWQVSLLIWRFSMRVLPAVPRRIGGSALWRRMVPWRQRLDTRFPRLAALVAGRLAVGSFVGLPLTLVAVAALYLLFLLTGIVEEVVEAEEIVAFDAAVSDLFIDYRDTFLLFVLAWITDLGAKPALVAVAIVATGFLWADRRPLYILPLWICIVGGLGTTWIGKFGFGRTRPEFVTDVIAHSPSFPSAHATGAVAVYGFIAYVLARDTPKHRQRFEITFWTCVLIGVIAFSRIFLAVHFASDVAAGLLVGGFWFLVALALTEIRRGARPCGNRGQPAIADPGAADDAAAG
jgi:undecaprenyl-diphosphatase